LFHVEDTEPSKLFQLLDTHFLDNGIPNLVLHPGGRTFGLVHLYPLVREYMHLLLAPLSEFDVYVTPVGCFEGRLAGRFACENSCLVAFLGHVIPF